MAEPSSLDQVPRHAERDGEGGNHGYRPFSFGLLHRAAAAGLQGAAQNAKYYYEVT